MIDFIVLRLWNARIKAATDMIIIAFTVNRCDVHFSLSWVF